MVNAATDLEYNGKFYKEGTKLPEELVKEFELVNPSLLDSYIELNGKWMKIDSPNIKDWVEKNKNSDGRLRKYFGVKPKPVETPKPVEEKDSPKPEFYTKEEFEKLTRKEQEEELDKLDVDYSYKDKEKDLVKKYLNAIK